ncbi:MAG: hypothetical protein ACD_46C00326G0001, partial [uncultured bacterium]
MALGPTDRLSLQISNSCSPNSLELISAISCDGDLKNN